jgi:hypothetical protein
MLDGRGVVEGEVAICSVETALAVDDQCDTVVASAQLAADDVERSQPAGARVEDVEAGRPV